MSTEEGIGYRRYIFMKAFSGVQEKVYDIGYTTESVYRRRYLWTLYWRYILMKAFLGVQEKV